MKKIAADNGSKPILVMYLHGGSSKGNDNEAQMKEAAVSVIAGYWPVTQHSRAAYPDCLAETAGGNGEIPP